MLFEPKVKVNFADMLDGIVIPPMYRVRQRFEDRHIERVRETVLDEMARFTAGRVLKNKRIAVTAGSRGISHNAEIMSAVLEGRRRAGARPFLVAAMGSHAGATPEGQLAMIRHLGIDPDALGVEVKASMDTVQVGALENGMPVYFSKDAFEADGVFAVNKIKPHADFKGEYESGLVKMLVIGLGKHKGCSTIHRMGFENFSWALPTAARVILDSCPILGGLAIVENAYDQPMLLEAVAAADFMDREKELLVLAKQNIARIKTEQLDVLIIDEIGKNISGEGMDPNVTGRPGSYLNEGFDCIRINQIVVRDVTEPSGGNGAGIGMADITTLSCVRKLDLGAMYTNSITAGILGPSRLPVILNSDEEAVKTAVKIGAGAQGCAPRIARVRNTLMLDEILISEALLAEFSSREDVEVVGRADFLFDEDGSFR